MVTVYRVDGALNSGSGCSGKAMATPKSHGNGVLGVVPVEFVSKEPRRTLRTFKTVGGVCLLRDNVGPHKARISHGELLAGVWTGNRPIGFSSVRRRSFRMENIVFEANGGEVTGAVGGRS